MSCCSSHMKERASSRISASARYPGLLSLAVFAAIDARGRGVGRALISRAIARARASAAHKLALEVSAHNTNGIALYESLGFKREGVLRSHVRQTNGELWDVVVMGLVL